MKKPFSLKRMFTSRMFRAGGYSAFAAAMVVAIAVAVNAIVGALPADMTQADLTEQALYTLSDQSRRLVRGLNEDVSLYLLANAGGEDGAIWKLLENYASLSGHVTAAIIDPTREPGFFSERELSQIYANSVLVESGDRSRLIDVSDIYVTDYQVDAYGYGYAASTGFDGENQITSAIHYVTSDDLPTVYAITGHGERELSETLLAQIEGENYALSEWNLLAADEVPGDADCLLLYAPASDLSAPEADMLIGWLEAGGHLLLLTDVVEEGAMPNLARVAGYMGMRQDAGMVLEGDRGSYWSQPYYLLPDMASHAITDPLIEGRYAVLAPYAQPIEATQDEAEVTFLLHTSDNSYVKAAGYDLETLEQEEADEMGPFGIAAVSERGGARMVWIASAALLNAEIDAMSAGANSDFFLNALGWMCGQEETISIRAKSLSVETLTVSARDNALWSLILVGVLPVACLLAGACVCYRRKKR